MDPIGSIGLGPISQIYTYSAYTLLRLEWSAHRAGGGGQGGVCYAPGNTPRLHRLAQLHHHVPRNGGICRVGQNVPDYDTTILVRPTPPRRINVDAR
jgi:hypothetical protein